MHIFDFLWFALLGVLGWITGSYLSQAGCAVITVIAFLLGTYAWAAKAVGWDEEILGLSTLGVTIQLSIVCVVMWTTHFY